MRDLPITTSCGNKLPWSSILKQASRADVIDFSLSLPKLCLSSLDLVLGRQAPTRRSQGQPCPCFFCGSKCNWKDYLGVTFDLRPDSSISNDLLALLRDIELTRIAFFLGDFREMSKCLYAGANLFCVSVRRLIRAKTIPLRTALRYWA